MKKFTYKLQKQWTPAFTVQNIDTGKRSTMQLSSYTSYNSWNTKWKRLLLKHTQFEMQKYGSSWHGGGVRGVKGVLGGMGRRKESAGLWVLVPYNHYALKATKTSYITHLLCWSKMHHIHQHRNDPRCPCCQPDLNRIGWSHHNCSHPGQIHSDQSQSYQNHLGWNHPDYSLKHKHIK